MDPMRKVVFTFWIDFFLVLLGTLEITLGSAPFFRINVLDSATGNGVPLVLLRTVNYIQLYTDSNGIAAFYEPGMMEQPVWFSVLADGYELRQNNLTEGKVEIYSKPYDSGVVLNTSGTKTVYLTRTQLAERRFRLTGGGLYRDSYLVGAKVPASAQNHTYIDKVSRSVGQDTLMLTRFKEDIFWFFGDTVCPKSARQNNCVGRGMYTVGAKTKFSESKVYPPALEYFGEDGMPRPMAKIEPLRQNTWIAGVFSIGDNLYGNYFKNPGDGASPDQAKQGMAKWSGESFEEISEWPRNSSLSLNGAHTIHAFGPAHASNEWVYFVNNHVYCRVPAKDDLISNYSAFEVLPRPKGQTINCNTINWNDYIKRYICIGDAPTGGPGLIVAFSETLFGSFEQNITRITSHSNSMSSCYNGLHLPYLDQGSVIFVACTFTSMWSNANKTDSLWSTCLFGINSEKNCAPVVPRYEYNNIISSLNLSNIDLTSID